MCHVEKLLSMITCESRVSSSQLAAASGVEPSQLEPNKCCMWHRNFEDKSFFRLFTFADAVMCWIDLESRVVYREHGVQKAKWCNQNVGKMTHIYT